MSPLASVRAAVVATSALPPMHCRRSAHIPTARSLARRYSTATAARYLRTRGWSIEAALFILTGHWPFPPSHTPGVR
jgi:hypothetical protein